MILLDTHVVLWLLEGTAPGPEFRLSRKGRAVIAEHRQKNQEIAVSDFTLWEIAMLASRGRIEFPGTSNELLRRVEAQFTLFRLDGRVAKRSQEFSAAYPKDPADRIIGATAIVHQKILITADRAIRASGEVRCIW